MRAKRINRDEQLRLIMECRASGLSDYQWCKANGVNHKTFYMWITRLRKAGYTIPNNAAVRTPTPVIQEVVKLPVVDSGDVGGLDVGQNANYLPAVPSSAIEIQFGSTTVRIFNGADVNVIQNVLQLMGGAAHAW